MALRLHNLSGKVFGLLAAATLAGCMTAPAEKPPLPMMPVPPAPAAFQLRQARFADLTGWRIGDMRASLSAFQRSCGVIAQKSDDAPLGGLQYAGTAGEWKPVCAQAALVDSNNPDAARQFFESQFTPYRVDQGMSPGLFTGYYEPELKGSRTRHGAYQTPLYTVPNDLVSVDLGLFRDSLKGQRLAGRVVMGRLLPYPGRAEIVATGLPEARPLLFVDDPVDAFFLQIQGSGRVVMDDGSVVRAVYAGQNGQPYTAIGAVLIRRGEMKREDVSLQSIRAWLLAHPQDAQELMNANASYVFFAERPIGDPMLGALGSEGVPLTPEASLAVDTSLHALGTPVWLETAAPDPNAAGERSFDQLLVMQDTGGAIRGAVRGDVYWGYGATPGIIAGRMRSEGRMSVLLPNGVAARLGPSAGFAAPP